MEENRDQIQNNIINYKIIKCKNFEKNRSCKYGNKCLFAHGDQDLRTKEQNLNQLNNGSMMIPNDINMGGIPQMMPGMDMNQMQLMTPMGGNMERNQYMINNMMISPFGEMNNNYNN